MSVRQVEEEKGSFQGDGMSGPDVETKGPKEGQDGGSPGRDHPAQRRLQRRTSARPCDDLRASSRAAGLL